MKEQKSSDQMEKSLSAIAAGPGQLCRVILRNACPPEWNLLIIAGGCKFFYRDGTEYQDGPHALKLASGQETSFSSNDPSKCVGSEMTVCTVKVPDQPAQNLAGSGDCPANECLLGITHTVAPKRSISKDALKKGKLTDLCEIRET
jgi:hypothetical protein